MSHAFTLRTNILNPVSSDQVELLPNSIITVDAGKIISVIPATDNIKADVEFPGCIAIPGLVDVHVHLSQYHIRGHYRGALLPWLSDFVFPEEALSSDYDYAYNLAEVFFQALYKAGTTTAVIYTAPFRSACEAAFEAAYLQNYRAFIGMTLMDQNSPAGLIQQTHQAMDDCTALIAEYHDPASGLQYIFTPRFAPTCTMELMQWIGATARKQKIWVQTHLSENPDEIEWVKALFKADSYTEVYQKAGILTDRTILAHCIHMSAKELDLLKATGCRIAHCPDSNFYLRSGEFPLAAVREKQIPFALGSDVGAGTTLNMLYHSKMFNFRQSTAPVCAEEAFYRATLGGAEMLDLAAVIGSITPGKDADFVLLDLPSESNSLSRDLVSELVFTGHEWNIRQVYSRGIRKI